MKQLTSLHPQKCSYLFCQQTSLFFLNSIELQEIANTMNQLEVCHEAHIVPSKVKTEVTLVAYVRLCAGDKDESVAIDEIKRHLISVLPGYMIPSHIIPVGTFWLNKNGKLDRSKLPSPSKQN
jgi:acyl-CoA synthetase (AMP-forming)/AMP-acid ligase II